jgi:hypothetical protein
LPPQLHPLWEALSASETILFKQTEHFFSEAEQLSHNTDNCKLTTPLHLIHFLLVCKKANLEQFGHSILKWHIIVIRGVYNPIIHAPIKKKEELEQLPLYLEIEPPPPFNKPEPKEEESRVIIIELF